MSEKKSGKNHPFYGTKFSNETRNKISEARRGRSLPLETREKISEASPERQRRLFASAK